MKTLIALALVLLATEAHAFDKWTTGDTALQAAFLTTLAIDRGQTAYGVHGKPAPNYHAKYYQEIGFAQNFIGTRPTIRQVNQYFATCAVLHTGIAAMLPKPYRALWQTFWIGVEVGTIRGNVSAGVSVRF